MFASVLRRLWLQNKLAASVYKTKHKQHPKMKHFAHSQNVSLFWRSVCALIAHLPLLMAFLTAHTKPLSQTFISVFEIVKLSIRVSVDLWTKIIKFTLHYRRAN